MVSIAVTLLEVSAGRRDRGKALLALKNFRDIPVVTLRSYPGYA
jgi:hypothetical protein